MIKEIGATVAVFGLLGVCISASTSAQDVTKAPAQALSSSAAQTTVVKQYCAGCHSERGKAGGVSLASFDVAGTVDHAAVAEQMIRKIRAGMMPLVASATQIRP